MEGAKNEGDKKPAADAGGKKVDDGSTTVVLKTEMHCEGCAKKIKRAVKNFPGMNYSPVKFLFVCFFSGVLELHTGNPNLVVCFGNFTVEKLSPSGPKSNTAN